MIGSIFEWFESRLDPFRSVEGEISPRSGYKILWRFVDSAKFPLASLLVVGLLSALIDVAMLALVGEIVDLLAKADPSSLLREQSSFLLGAAAIVLLLKPLTVILGLLVADQSVQANFSPLVRWQMHRRLMAQSLEFFQREFAGNIASKTWQSGQSAAEIVASLLQIVWSNLVYAVSVLVLLSWLNVWLSALVLAWIACFAATSSFFVPLTRKKSRISAEAFNAINGHLVDVYANAQTVKLFPAKATEEDYVRQSLQSFVAKSKDFLRIVTAGRSAMVVQSAVFTTLIGVVTIWLWEQGRVSVGQITLIFALIFRLDGQLQMLLGLLTGLLRSYGVFLSSMEVMTKPVLLRDKEDALALPLTNTRVVFDAVQFGYSGSKRVINGLSFAIEPGEKVGLIGSSGAGKSTIAHLLLRFYDVEAGRITVGGTDIRDATQLSLRNNIGLVTQDISLLHRSVLENIAIGKDGASRSEIVAAARRAHALEFIEGLEDGYGRKGFEAHVGQRGLKLSGGQRQRIALA